MVCHRLRPSWIPSAPSTQLIGAMLAPVQIQNWWAAVEVRALSGTGSSECSATSVTSSESVLTDMGPPRPRAAPVRASLSVGGRGVTTDDMPISLALRVDGVSVVVGAGRRARARGVPARRGRGPHRAGAAGPAGAVGPLHRGVRGGPAAARWGAAAHHRAGPGRLGGAGPPGLRARRGRRGPGGARTRAGLDLRHHAAGHAGGGARRRAAAGRPALPGAVRRDHRGGQLLDRRPVDRPAPVRRRGVPRPVRCAARGRRPRAAAGLPVRAGAGARRCWPTRTAGPSRSWPRTARALPLSGVSPPTTCSPPAVTARR